jgi:predicted nucleic acid-binding protein
MRTILVDCDIASCLAKINRVDLLRLAFSEDEIFITESVSSELQRAKQAGFSFPDRVFGSIPVISVNQEERKILNEMPLNRSIHFGEAEGLVICRNRDGIFLTNDSRVIQYCRDNDLKVLDLKDILLLLSIRKAVMPSEMRKIIHDIETKDNTTLKYKSLILRT